MDVQAPRPAAHTRLDCSERNLYQALQTVFIAEPDSTVNTDYGRQDHVAAGNKPHMSGSG